MCHDYFLVCFPAQSTQYAAFSILGTFTELKICVKTRFAVNHNYKSSIAEFECIELYPLKGTYSPNRHIVLTDDVFLLFESQEENKESYLLIAWSFLDSLIKMQVSRGTLITFTWLAKDDLAAAWEQTFEIREKVKEFVENVKEKMRMLSSISIEKAASLRKARFKEEEVTTKSMAELDIEEINENIALYESDLQTNLTISAVQTLMLLYQKVCI